MTALCLRKSIDPATAGRGYLLIAVALACFGLSPAARAVCQQGCDLTRGNTFLGEDALGSNTYGTGNTAVGNVALNANTRGSGNTATGNYALTYNLSGGQNTATGDEALGSNTSGSQNTATGFGALGNNKTSTGNTAIGYQALQFSTGHGNVALGSGAGSGVTSANNVICIGTYVAGENQTGSCFIGHIFGQHVGPDTGTHVYVDTNGRLGTVLSARRFKHDIQPMDKASEAILALKPVAFHYKSDAKNTPCFGLIAEEVAEVNPNLIVRDKDGEILSVRYEAVNAMLLNEFLKEHRIVQEQGQELQKQAATIAKQQKQIEALTAGLQKVSAQLEVGKPAPQTALNKQ